MHSRGADAIAMEVSSHGLDLRRVDGITFDVAAFTNLTRDHLDWHGDMERYLAAKARLFTPELARHGVVLLDAPGARDLVALARIPLTTLGVAPDADVAVLDRRVERDGSRAVLRIDGNDLPVRTVMRGTHNLDNVLVAVVTAVRAGLDPDVVARGVADVAAPPGRLEPFGGDGRPLVLVDYAHTPDAVAGAVVVGRGLTLEGGRLHVVIGAGGDRDRDKRAPMGVPRAPLMSSASPMTTRAARNRQRSAGACSRVPAQGRPASLRSRTVRAPWRRRSALHRRGTWCSSSAAATSRTRRSRASTSRSTTATWCGAHSPGRCSHDPPRHRRARCAARRPRRARDAGGTGSST